MNHNRYISNPTVLSNVNPPSDLASFNADILPIEELAIRRRSFSVGATLPDSTPFQPRTPLLSPPESPILYPTSSPSPLKLKISPTNERQISSPSSTTHSLHKISNTSLNSSHGSSTRLPPHYLASNKARKTSGPRWRPTIDPFVVKPSSTVTDLSVEVSDAVTYHSPTFQPITPKFSPLPLPELEPLPPLRLQDNKTLHAKGSMDETRDDLMGGKRTTWNGNDQQPDKEDELGYLGGVTVEAEDLKFYEGYEDNVKLLDQLEIELNPKPLSLNRTEGLKINKKAEYRLTGLGLTIDENAKGVEKKRITTMSRVGRAMFNLEDSESTSSEDLPILPLNVSNLVRNKTSPVSTDHGNQSLSAKPSKKSLRPVVPLSIDTEQANANGNRGERSVNKALKRTPLAINHSLEEVGLPSPPTSSTPSPVEEERQKTLDVLEGRTPPPLPPKSQNAVATRKYVYSTPVRSNESTPASIKVTPSQNVQNVKTISWTAKGRLINLKASTTVKQFSNTRNVNIQTPKQFLFNLPSHLKPLPSRTPPVPVIKKEVRTVGTQTDLHLEKVQERKGNEDTNEIIIDEDEADKDYFNRKESFCKSTWSASTETSPRSSTTTILSHLGEFPTVPQAGI